MLFLHSYIVTNCPVDNEKVISGEVCIAMQRVQEKLMNLLKMNFKKLKRIFGNRKRQTFCCVHVEHESSWWLFKCKLMLEA